MSFFLTDYGNFLVMTLFIVGFWGVMVIERDIIYLIISVELILLAVVLNSVLHSIIFNCITTEIFSLFILVIAAAETAIVLAIVYNFYKMGISVSMEDLNKSERKINSLVYYLY